MLYSVPSGWSISAGSESRGVPAPLAGTTPAARRRRSASRTVCRLTAYSVTSASSPGNSATNSPALSRADQVVVQLLPQRRPGPALDGPSAGGRRGTPCGGRGHDPDDAAWLAPTPPDGAGASARGCVAQSAT